MPVQSWTNFMSPTGGTMDNDYADGLKGMILGVGASNVAPWLFNSLEKVDIREARLKYFNYRKRAFNNPQVGQRIGRMGPEMNMATSYPYAKNYGPQFKKRLASEINLVKGKYSRLRLGAKAIGWGYAALSAAEFFEYASTPSLTPYAAANEMMMTNNPMQMLDTSVAATQRQRALMAIHDSQMTLRGVIGQEASYLHR